MLGLLHIKRNVFHRYFSLFLTHSEYLGINASEMTPWTLRPEKNNQELCWNSKRQDKHVQNFLFRVSICFCPFPNMIKSTRSEFPSVSICFCLFPNQVKTSCTGFPSVPVSFQNDLQTSYTEILSVSISFQTWSRLVHGFHLFLSVSKLDEDFLYRVSICFSQVPNMIKTSSWLVQGFHLFLPVSICFSLFPIVQVVRKDSNFFVLSFKWNGNMKICSRQ